MKGWLSLSPWVLPLLHLCLCLAIELDRDAGQGGWRWFPVFYLDFPFSILLLPLARFFSPLLVFGTAGTLWWFILSTVFVFLLRKVFRWANKTTSE
jgi:hypothetical protein